jgi:hypothetical protein
VRMRLEVIPLYLRCAAAVWRASARAWRERGASAAQRRARFDLNSLDKGGNVLGVWRASLALLAGRWGRLLSVFSLTAVSCSSRSGEGLCASVQSRADGIHLVDCSEGTIALKDIRYDSRGAKQSYSFVVSCDGKSARGVWSRSGNFECVEGATDPCQRGGVCTPKSDADCRSIANCKEWGDCGYRDGKCVPTEEGCARSDVPCGLSGACHLGADGACTVLSDKDCQMPFGVCPECQFKGACVTYGTCYAENGRCVARQAAECRRSTQCAFSGQCSLEGNTCVAATDADCMSSEVCRTSGQCRALGGFCTTR